MSNGIRSLPRYQHGGPHYTKEDFAAFRARRAKEEHRRRAMAGEPGYPSIGPRPSWAERVAAQVRSVPRRINRALQPETAGETAALVGTSMTEPLGTSIDVADIIAGFATRDLPRVGWGALGFATPFVAGSAMRNVVKHGGLKALPGRISHKWEDLRLPMDEASVARRMEEQGYEGFLHGTGRRGEALSHKALDPDRPFFQVDNPDVAAEYGQPRNVYSRAPRQLTFDAEGAAWSDIPMERIRGQIDPSRLEEFDKLVSRYGPQGASLSTEHLDTDILSRISRQMGYSGFDAHNLRDAPWTGLSRRLDPPDAPSLVRSTLDPGLIRYEGARFNPRDLGLNDPMAGIAGLLGVGATGAARRNYVERNRQ